MVSKPLIDFPAKNGAPVAMLLNEHLNSVRDVISSLNIRKVVTENCVPSRIEIKEGVRKIWKSYYLSA